jgi:sarcosine oxidase subunit gamma
MGYDLHITGPHTRTVIDLRGKLAHLPPAALPEWPARPGSRTTRGTQTLVWCAPAGWLLIAPLDDEAAIEAALCPLANAESSITAISDSLAFFALSGADAAAALAVACPIDLHPTAFAPDAATFTEAFGTRALVMRDGPAWALAVGCSHAAYVGECLRGIQA